VPGAARPPEPLRPGPTSVRAAALCARGGASRRNLTLTGAIFGLSAYRHAQATFAGDPRALELVDRLSHDWPGDGDQLVAIVREAL
jgi:hypothetical protein